MSWRNIPALYQAIKFFLLEKEHIQNSLLFRDFYFTELQSELFIILYLYYYKIAHGTEEGLKKQFWLQAYKMHIVKLDMVAFDIII